MNLTPRSINRQPGIILMVHAGLALMAAAIAALTWLLNMLEIHSVFTRHFGSGAWKPLFVAVLCVVIGLKLGSLGKRLLIIAFDNENKASSEA